MLRSRHEERADEAIDFAITHQPVQRWVDLCGQGCIIGIQRDEILVDNATLERLMAAMLTPGLRQRLEFGVGGFTPFVAIVRLDRAHFMQIERQDACLTDTQQIIIRRGRNRQTRHEWLMIRRRLKQMRIPCAPLSRARTGRVAQHRLDQVIVQVAFITRLRHPIAPQRLHRVQTGNADAGSAGANTLRLVIGYAGAIRNLDPKRPISASDRLINQIIEPDPGCLLHHRIVEQIGGQTRHGHVVEITVEQEEMIRSSGIVARMHGDEIGRHRTQCSTTASPVVEAPSGPARRSAAIATSSGDIARC